MVTIPRSRTDLIRACFKTMIPSTAEPVVNGHAIVAADIPSARSDGMATGLENHARHLGDDNSWS